MLLLHTEHFEAFADGLKHRIQTQKDFALLPVLGAIKWIGKISFSCVYVDVIDPSSCSFILVKVKPVSEHDVEKKVAEGLHTNCIHDRWLKDIDQDLIVFDKYHWVCFWTNKDKESLDLTNFSNLLDYRDFPRIKAVDYSLLDKLCRSFQDYAFVVRTKAFVCVLLEEPRVFPCPQGYIIRTIDMEDCETAMTSYKYAYVIRNNLMLCAANGYGVGAYEIESGKLVSSAFLNWEGAISGLQTEEQHRNKGLAKAVVSFLANLLFKEGCPIFCYVEKDVETTDLNFVLYRKIGFVTDENLAVCWTKT